MRLSPQGRCVCPVPSARCHPYPWGHPGPPASRNSQYLGLKSALQGPEGAWVWEQGGQSRDGGREGWEKLQERKWGVQAPAEHSGPGGTPAPPSGPPPSCSEAQSPPTPQPQPGPAPSGPHGGQRQGHSRWNVAGRGCPAWACTCPTRGERGKGEPALPRDALQGPAPPTPAGPEGA